MYKMTKPLVKLFNLDLHVSVIADLKDIAQTLYGSKVEITNWSISGHNWVFNARDPDVRVINQNTWRAINPQMIAEFQTIHDEFLSQFDGFIVTHTPVFCLLYEKYGKPILLVNSCRYEQPYSWSLDFAGWQWLSQGLLRLSDSGLLTVVSNNKADQEYLRRGTGVTSVHIPSLCLYTGCSYRPLRKEAVVFGDRGFFPESELLVRKPERYSWHDLYSYKAIVHIPYEMSTMSLFEQYSAGIPLFLPTRAFYTQCILEQKMPFGSIYSARHDPALIQSSLLSSELKDALTSGDFWLDRADFYDFENFKYVRFYSSREDLLRQLAEFEDTDREKRMAWISERKGRIYDMWRNLFFKHFFSRISIEKLLCA